MANAAAVGYGPISFFTTTGIELSIPLSELYFDAGGGVHSNVYGGTPGLSEWLTYLVNQGRITRGSTPTPGPAMVVTATEAGTAGNRITVNVGASTATPPDPNKVHITVSEVDVYAGLTVANIESFLGSSAVVGSSPGLLRLKLPLGTGDPVVADGAAASPQTTPPSWSFNNGATPAAVAFTLEARRAGTAPARITAHVGPVAAGTFTLTVTWSYDQEVNVAGLAAFATAVGFLVQITAPDGSMTFTNLPATGTTQLGGGADPAQASATVLASS
jgi:hypothetical protein